MPGPALAWPSSHRKVKGSLVSRFPCFAPFPPKSTHISWNDDLQPNRTKEAGFMYLGNRDADVASEPCKTRLRI